MFGTSDGFFLRQIKVLNLVKFALKEFDIIHYNSGRPLLLHIPGKRNFWPPHQAIRYAVSQTCFPLFEFTDVAVFKRAGKGIVVTYQGSDARQGDYCRANHKITFVDEVGPDFYTARSDTRKRRKIARFGRYADRIYAVSPDLLSMVTETELLPVSRDMRQWTPLYPEPRARPCVLHAPSHRGVKGTRFLLEAVERLRREGVPFDLQLVENLPHAEAKQRYKEADLVVDQLLLGWYGGFAVEVMALGKPVIAYLRESDLQALPEAMRKELPVIDANPETIYDVLKEWLTTRRHALPERGRAARAYVERWHDARAIAKRLVGDYGAILREREANALSQR